ncbi:uncharacterized protein [Spinacia oleracea]|nr:uncharacterized protein LOC110803564 isoform X2 [Spinacia oleracea]
MEVKEIKERILKLSKRLGHGKTKWAEEKQILKELEHLQTQTELPNGQVKEAEAAIEIHWCRNYGSKFDLKRYIHECLKKIREYEEQDKVAKLQCIPEIAKMERKLATLEKKYNIVKQEEEKANDRLVKLQHIPVLEMQVEKQVTLYKKYCKILNKAEELATHKSLATLEE